VRKVVGLLFLSLVFGASCGDKGKEESKDSANVKKGVKPVADPEMVVLDTTMGPITIELYSNIAPKHVERFKTLAREGFYNGVTFHRVDPELGIVQSGDPLSKDNDPTNDGSGDSNYPDLQSEFSDIPFDRAIVGAARQGGGPGMSEQEAFNTANSQFFITLKRQPGFDDQYTVFGKVIDGMNTADIISTAPTEEGTERPADKILIRGVSIQPHSKSR
jgi:cyclophilin family peptidyl-prolyl cis-trans isomerase